MFIQTIYHSSHCKFVAYQKWEPAGRMGDFGNFLVLNIDWVQFVSKNCEILHPVRGLYDKYSAT